MKQKLLSILSLTFLLLSACGEKGHDVQYYLDHPEERKAKVDECQAKPDGGKNNPECENAFEAEFKAMFRGDSMPQIK